MANMEEDLRFAQQTAEQFGVILRRRRLELEWTQEVASEKVHMAREAYARLERGSSMPSFSTLVLLVTRMGLDPAHILGQKKEGGRADHLPDAHRERLLARISTLDEDRLRLLDELLLYLSTPPALTSS